MLSTRKFACALAVILSLMVVTTTTGVASAQQDADVTSYMPTLSVKAPNMITVGDIVPITITELHSGNPVAGSEVWALGMPIVSHQIIDKEPAIEPKWHYRFLGTTDEDGKITPSPVFGKAGRYYIMATNSGYAPGLHIMMVKPKALVVQAPPRSVVDEPVIIKVIDRNSGEPVSKAKVYALHRPVVRILEEEAPREAIAPGRDLPQKQQLLNKATSSTSEVPVLLDETEASDENLAARRGEYLGETNNNGEIRHIFDTPGRYRITAAKRGYIDGVTHMTVYPEGEYNALIIRGPQFADINEDVTFTILERDGGSAVEGAIVYAIQQAIRQSANDMDRQLMPEPQLKVETEASLKALVDKHGRRLGKTDENGQVTHAFSKQGRYSIVALKDGYSPGTAHISIGVHRTQTITGSEVGDNSRTKPFLNSNWPVYQEPQ